MMNMKRNVFWLGMLAMILTLAMTVVGCDDGSGSGGGGGGIPSALVGKWYSKADNTILVFEITSAGKFIEAQNTYDISVSGNTVDFKYSGTSAGSFDYSISNSEMTMTNGTGVGMAYVLLSPVVKGNSGNNPGGGGGLSALVGEWQSNGMSVFEITSAGKFIMNGTTYDISVSGSTATLKFGGATVGTFDYAINSGQMVMFNGTGIGTTIVLLSPVGKSGGGGGPVTGVSLSSTSLSLNVGSTASLTAIISPTNATNKSVSWSSSDSNVVTFVQLPNNSVVVTGVSEGTATITVTTADGNRQASCVVTVIPGAAVTGVSLSSTSLSLNVGSTASLTAIISPTNATNKTVTWASSDPSIVNFSHAGGGLTVIVTGVSLGTTMIMVTTQDGGFMASCTVTVIDGPGGGGNPGTGGNRDSRLVNGANDAWVDSYQVGNRDGFIFKADGTVHLIDDYTNTTPGVWKIHETGTWTTSGNNSLTFTGNGGSITYSYTVTGTTLTLDGAVFTKTQVTVVGGGPIVVSF